MYKLEIFKNKELVNTIIEENKERTTEKLAEVFGNYWQFKTNRRPFKSVIINDVAYSNYKEFNATIKMYLNPATNEGPLYTYKYYFNLDK